MAIYRVAIRTSMGTSNFINVVHLSTADSDPSNVTSEWNAAVGAAWIAALSTSATLEDVTATNLSTLAQHIKSITTGGSLTGDCCPPQCAGVITWRTAQVGRKYRGRIYMPAIPEGSQTLGSLTTAQQSLYATIAAAMQATWPAALSGNLVVYHRDTGTGTAVTSYTVREFVYTQRRRTIGQGS